jgi:septum formation protein
VTDSSRLFILASASASRRRVLESARVRFEVAVSDFEESWMPQDDPAQTVASLALGKTLSVARGRHDAFVLGCDSLFFCDGLLLGKPGSDDEVERRWRTMSGRSGILYTGHALAYRDQVSEEVVATTVTFAAIEEAELAAYVASGESVGVAGGFTLEGRSAAFIERIDGDPSNVLGLSVAALRRLLRTYGVAISELWI